MTANAMGDKMILKLQSFGYNLINFDDRERSEMLNDGMLEFIKERTLPLSNVKRKGIEADTKRRLDLSALITSQVEYKRNPDGRDGDFMLGTADNGALKTPDKDYQYSSGGDYVETDYGVFVKVPDEVLFPLSEFCSTSRNGIIKEQVPIEVISYEEYVSNIHNTFKSPYYNKAWRMDWGSYTTGSTATEGVSSKYTNTSLTGFTGVNADGSGNNITIDTHRSSMLIPGKDWVIEKYRMSYIKRPSNIVVDTISPINQKHCELHPSVHDEIVDKAVQLAIESRIPAEGKYQVAEKENVENQ